MSREEELEEGESKVESEAVKDSSILECQGLYLTPASLSEGQETKAREIINERW